MVQDAQQQMVAILTILRTNSQGLARGQISELLSFSINNKTLQRRLARLVNDGQILKQGDKKTTRYYPVQTSIETTKGQLKDN